MYKYVDDSSSSEIVSYPFDTSNIQDQVNSIVTWLSTNRMKINVKETKEFRVSFLNVDPIFDPIVINGQSPELVKCFKLLGVFFTSNLSWNTHVEYMFRKASKRLYILRILKRSGFSVDHLRRVYCSFIRPILESACLVWHFSLTLTNSDRAAERFCGARDKISIWGP